MPADKMVQRHASPVSHNDRLDPLPPEGKPRRSARQRPVGCVELPPLMSGMQSCKKGNVSSAKKVLESSQHSGFDAMQNALRVAVEKMQLGAVLDDKWAIISHQLNEATSRDTRRIDLQHTESLCTSRPLTTVPDSSLLCARLDAILAFCSTLSTTFSEIANNVRGQVHMHLFCTEPKVTPLTTLDTLQEFDALAAVYSSCRTLRELHGTQKQNAHDPRMRVVRRVLQAGVQSTQQRVFNAWRKCAHTEKERRLLGEQIEADNQIIENSAEKLRAFEHTVKELELTIRHNQARSNTQLKEKQEELSVQAKRLRIHNDELQKKNERLELHRNEIASQLSVLKHRTATKDSEMSAELAKLQNVLDLHLPHTDPERNRARTQLCQVIEQHVEQGTSLLDLLSSWIAVRCASYWSSVFDEGEASVTLFPSKLAVSRPQQEMIAVVDFKATLLVVHSLSSRQVSIKQIRGANTLDACVKLLHDVCKNLGFKLPSCSNDDYIMFSPLRMSVATGIAKVLLDTSQSSRWLATEDADPEFASTGNTIDIFKSCTTMQAIRNAADKRLACLSEVASRESFLSRNISSIQQMETEYLADFIPQCSGRPVLYDPVNYSVELLDAFDAGMESPEERDLVAAIMTANLKRLDEVFKNYCVAGRLGRLEIMSFLKDAKLIDEPGMLGLARKRSVRKSLGVSGVLQEMLRATGVTDQTMLDRGGFFSFLTLLASTSVKELPKNSLLSAKMQHLLEKHVLPNALYITLDGIAAIMNDEDVRKVFSDYRGALTKVYTSYLVTTHGGQNKTLTFPAFRRLAEEYRLVDESLTHLSLQQTYQRLCPSQGADYQDYLALIVIVSYYKFPSPYYPANQKLMRFLSGFIPRGGATRQPTR